MPFRKHAKMVITNESNKDVTIFYEVDLTLGDQLGADALYFHAHWRRENPTALGREFEILPKVKGAGRFLGTNIGLIEDPAYHGGWFGEGEVKIYLDGDGQHPTLAGTGTEDYIGTAWGQDKFSQRTTGCPIYDRDHKSWCFYRYHVDDPVFFDTDCRVTLQNMGGISGAKLNAARRPRRQVSDRHRFEGKRHRQSPRDGRAVGFRRSTHRRKLDQLLAPGRSLGYRVLLSR